MPTEGKGCISRLSGHISPYRTGVSEVYLHGYGTETLLHGVCGELGWTKQAVGIGVGSGYGSAEMRRARNDCRNERSHRGIINGEKTMYCGNATGRTGFSPSLFKGGGNRFGTGSGYPRIMVRSILNRFTAFTAWGTLAGMTARLPVATVTICPPARYRTSFLFDSHKYP